MSGAAQPQPRPETRAQTERAGLGAPAPRLDPHPPLRPRRSEVIAIAFTTAIAGTERLFSKRLHTPFRVDSISIGVNSTDGAGVFVNLYLADLDTTTADIGDLVPQHGLAPTNDVGAAIGLIAADGSVDIPSGVVIRALPTRFVLAVQNLTAATKTVHAAITITHLDEGTNPHNPTPTNP
jgi:hypothetical protein